MRNTFICPFCNKQTYSSYINYYSCNNHKGVNVDFYYIYIKNKIKFIKLGRGAHLIYIKPFQCEMVIYDLELNPTVINCVDKKMTPENFESRIESYLIFQ
jgi:hypothetical protein